MLPAPTSISPAKVVLFEFLCAPEGNSCGSSKQWVARLWVKGFGVWVLGCLDVDGALCSMVSGWCDVVWRCLTYDFCGCEKRTAVL